MAQEPEQGAGPGAGTDAGAGAEGLWPPATAAATATAMATVTATATATTTATVPAVETVYAVCQTPITVHNHPSRYKCSMPHVKASKQQAFPGWCVLPILSLFHPSLLPSPMRGEIVTVVAVVAGLFVI